MRKFNVSEKQAVASVCILLTIGLSGCLSLVPNYHVYDEFTNTHRYTLTESERNDEYGSDIGDADIKCCRLVTANSESVAFYFSIERETNSFGLEPKGFMKANGKQFELQLSDIFDEERSRERTTITKDSTATGKQRKTISTTHQNWIVTNFVVPVTPEMLAAIRSGRDMMFRFYFGPDMATYKLSKITTLMYRLLDQDPRKK
ncbi:MAG: hypothetical protein Q8861_09570 [Bacteroidota bacterium]|nr:hypothetical protein [Bacteroidota bacterium]